MTTLLRAEHISILRAQQPIIRRLSLNICAGDAIHLTGENGSGKTTLLQALAGLLPLNAGKIFRHSPLIYLGHQAGIKTLLTVEENLHLAARLYHAMPENADTQKRIEYALAQMAIAHLSKRQARYLSAGQQRRVQLARLYLPCPALWLLDEPLTALDKNSSAQLAKHCSAHLDAGGAILFTSHQAFLSQEPRLQSLPLSALFDQSPAKHLMLDEDLHF